MARLKIKLVFKSTNLGNFSLVKAVNTLEYGVPGDTLSREQVDRIISKNSRNFHSGAVTIEILDGKT